MALEFTTTDASATLNGIKVLVYGGSGMGKTVLCATAPTPLILSAESGLLSLRKFKIPVIVIKTADDLTQAFDFVANNPQGRSFETVCLDSLTEIAEVVLANAKRQVKDPRQAYGELIEKMQTAIRLFRDLPGRNVYMSAKMEPMKDEMTGIITYGPSMPGAKLGPSLPYFFDEVFRLGINKTPNGEQYRFLQTQPEMQYIAKDRSGALDPIEAPNLSNVFSKIKQGI